jgi:TolB-like protein
MICVPAFVVSWRAESRGLRPQSIAIMRFRSAGVGDELLGMGIRDTLRAKLGNLDDVTVRPIEPEVADDVVDAGRQLNVDVVVTGSIQHDEDKIRVAVEMVDVSNKRLIWGNTFDDSFSNAFELQDSITNAVLSALKRPKLSGALHRFNGFQNDADVSEVLLVRRNRPLVQLDDPPGYPI